MSRERDSLGVFGAFAVVLTILGLIALLVHFIAPQILNGY
jgi:hypothetical protein